MQSPVTSGSETPVKTPVKTVMLAVASGGKRLDRHVKHDDPELSRHEAQQVMARLKHSVALQFLHDLRETNPIIGMATSLDIDNEEEYPGHPPPFSPHTECDNEDCRQVMLENVALRLRRMPSMMR